MQSYEGTPEEIIRALILRNRGRRAFLSLDDMRVMAEERGLEPEPGLKKTELYDLVATVYSAEELAERGHVGLSSFCFRKRFDVTNPELRHMAKAGFIHEAGDLRYRGCGEYLYNSRYSVFDYCRLSKEEVRAWLDEHPPRYGSKRNGTSLYHYADRNAAR